MRGERVTSARQSSLSEASFGSEVTATNCIISCPLPTAAVMSLCLPECGYIGAVCELQLVMLW